MPGSELRGWVAREGPERPAVREEPASPDVPAAHAGDVVSQSDATTSAVTALAVDRDACAVWLTASGGRRAESLPGWVRNAAFPLLNERGARSVASAPDVVSTHRMDEVEILETGTFEVATFADELALAPRNLAVGTSRWFENDAIRVWEVRLEPGQRTPFHAHT